jgi:hypothetical protein
VETERQPEITTLAVAVAGRQAFLEMVEMLPFLLRKQDQAGVVERVSLLRLLLGLEQAVA